MISTPLMNVVRHLLQYLPAATIMGMCVILLMVLVTWTFSGSLQEFVKRKLFTMKTAKGKNIFNERISMENIEALCECPCVHSIAKSKICTGTWKGQRQS